MLNQFFVQLCYFYHLQIGYNLFTSSEEQNYVIEQPITSPETDPSVTSSYYYPISFKSMSCWWHWLGNWWTKGRDKYSPPNNLIKTGGILEANQSVQIAIKDQNINSEKSAFEFKGSTFDETCNSNIAKISYPNHSLIYPLSRGELTRDAGSETIQPIRSAHESNKEETQRKEKAERLKSRKGKQTSKAVRDLLLKPEGRTSFIYLLVNLTHLFSYTMMLKLFVFYPFR